MSVTKYRHHIDTIKGEDYVLHKDYTELMENLEQEIERLNNKLEKIKEIINYYAVEDEDYSKIYNDEEKELLKVLGEYEK